MKKINICGVDYEVIITDESSFDKWGYINFASSTIYIKKSLGTQAQERTLLHEIIHGILSASGIEEQDEKHIEIIASGLYQMGVRF